MDRAQILRWLEEHPGVVHGEPEQVLSRCEASVRQHATEDAWLAARAYVEGRMHQWETAWGFHATEAAVAREICPRLAAELKRHEPTVPEDADAHLIGEALLRDLEPEAQRALHEWVQGLAGEVEHRIWDEIVRLTRRHARELERQGRLSTDRSWEATENYSHKAAHIAQLLLEEYAVKGPASR